MRCKFRQYLGDQLSVVVSRMGMLFLRESKCQISFVFSESLSLPVYPVLHSVNIHTLFPLKVKH